MINKSTDFLDFLMFLFLLLIILHNLLINNFNCFHFINLLFIDSLYQSISINLIFVNDIHLLINLNIPIPLYVITFMIFGFHLTFIIKISLILYLIIH